MDRSVYTPGAGHMPPVLAGRDELLRGWQRMLNDVGALGRVRARDMILTGPRGVGKTAAMTAFSGQAAAAGYEVLSLQAVRGRSTLVDSLLARAESRLSSGAGPWQRTRRAFERVAGVNLSLGGVGAGLTLRHPGHPVRAVDPGTLAEALAVLAAETRRENGSGGVMVCVDEVQAASGEDLALLAGTLHRLNVDHPDATVVFAGTGLPHTLEVLRKAGVTHPDRLFVIEPVSPTLSPSEAARAIVEPAMSLGVTWSPDAVEAVVVATSGYPAHLQLVADTVWREAPGPNAILLEDVHRALPQVGDELTRRTLGPRWDRMPDRQMEYLAALAVHGGRATTEQVTHALGRSAQELSWVRDALIAEGDIYAPRRGHIQMTVPLFATYVLDQYEAARAESAHPEALTSLTRLRAQAALPGAPEGQVAHREGPDHGGPRIH